MSLTCLLLVVSNDLYFTHWITGIQSTDIITIPRTEDLPTISCSISTWRELLVRQALRRITAQMSIVKMVDAELKTEVSEDIRAANITDSIRPRRPGL